MVISACLIGNERLALRRLALDEPGAVVVAEIHDLAQQAHLLVVQLAVKEESPAQLACGATTGTTAAAQTNACVASPRDAPDT